jgi:putative phage-type endonuclease
MINEQQRLERRNGIGGSDMPIILGLSNYKTPYQLYCEKKGILDFSEETPLQYWGKQIEVLIRKEFRKRNKVKVETPKEAVVHPFYSFLRGNLDGYIPKWRAVFEAKCSNSFMAKLWGEHGTDTIPMEYLVQVAFYCSVTNADCAHIAVLIGGYDYREYKYTRDLELEQTILNAACAFWDAVKNETPPPATAMVDLKLLYPAHSPNKIKTVDADIKSHLISLSETKQKMKELDDIENDYKFKILSYMEDAECLVDMDGKPLATYKANKKGSRTFLLKGIGNE